ncbi:MAG: hypothetical protein IJW05_12465 [Lentisphaeria bacterium]|nr:hypothetical protein [Lentisphaeria bacterium]
MSIQSEIERLQQAKTNLKTAINGKGGNITDDKLDSYYMYVNEINTGSDVSGVTATPADVRKTVKYVTASGELVSGTMPDSTASVADGKVTVTAGYLSADYVYTLPAVEGTDLSFITAGAGQILSGYVGADKDGNPVSGTITTKTSNDVTFVGGTVELPSGYYAGVSKSIPTGTTTQNGNTVNISEGWHYDQSIDVGAAYPGGTITPGTEDQIINADSYITSTLTIKGDSNLQAENIVEGKTIFGIPGSHKCATTEVVAGVIVDDGGTMKVQKLTFDGTTPSDDGDPVTVDSFYTFNTGRDEPVYDSGISGGSTMEIYKCVDAEGLTWWIVSGCGSTEANGRYYRGDDIVSEYGGSYASYYQQNGACSITYDSYNGYWALKAGSTNLYKDESYNYHDGDPSQCTSWTTDSGVAPTPTINTETTTGNGWRGLKYNTEDYTVADTVTELTYKNRMPKLGKFYTSDAYYMVDPIKIFMLYANFSAINHEISYSFNPYRVYLENISSSDFQTVNGVKCLTGSGSQKGYIDFNASTMEDWTASCMFTASTLDQESYVCPVSIGDAIDSSKQNNHTKLIVYYKPNTVYQGDSFASNDSIVYTEIEKNKWYHATISAKSDGTFTFYINGNSTQTGKTEYSTRTMNTISLFKLIQAYTNSNTAYKGSISEIKVWKGCLSDEEIKAEADRCLAMVEATQAGTELTVTSSNLSSFAGTYTLNDSTVTGTSRVWTNNSNSTMTIAYQSDGWYLCNSGIKAIMIASGDNPWDSVVSPWTVTVNE